MPLPPQALAILATVGATKEIVDLAKTVFNLGSTAVDKANTYVSGYDNIKRNSALSLTQYTKQTTLRSRVYIDDSLRDEEVLPGLVKALHTMYTGLILNALQLSQFVTQGKTVQDFIGTVATESMADYRDVSQDLTALQGSLEKFTTDESKKILAVGDAEKEYTGDELKTEYNKRKAEALSKLGKPEQTPDVSLKEVKITPTEIVPIGKLIEVTLTNPDHPDKSAKLMINVQMVPYLIPASIVSMFINKDSSLGFMTRLTQWKAGEISFWKDLLFQVDRINKSYQIAKNDPNKLFYDFMANVAKKDRALVTKNLTQGDASKKTHNLANSVMIFSTDAIAQAKAESGIDLHNKAARNRYFADTYSMVIAVVDPMYHQVTLYLNGIDDVGVYTYAQFEHKSGDKDGGLDLLKVLAQFQNGKSARF